MNLSIHGVAVEVLALNEGAGATVEELGLDFAGFARTDNGTSPAPADLRFELELGAAPSIGRARPLFKTKMCRVRGLGRRRVCDYGGQSVAVADNGDSQRLFRLHSPDADLLREIAYTAMLSAIGEELDLRGLHRVHALGLRNGERPGLLILPHGGGKSALAMLLLQSTAIAIYSDENPLCREGLLYPYPLRIALRPEVAQALKLEQPSRSFRRRLFPRKNLYPIPATQVASPARVHFVMVGAATKGKPRIKRATPLRTLVALLHSMVIGIGLAQMAEHMLRWESLGRLTKIALSRLREAIRLSFAAKGYVFYYGHDAAANHAVFLEFLRNNR